MVGPGSTGACHTLEGKGEVSGDLWPFLYQIYVVLAAVVVFKLNLVNFNKVGFSYPNASLHIFILSSGGEPYYYYFILKML